MFSKVDWFIRDQNGIKYLAIFTSEKYNVIFNWARFFKFLSQICNKNYNQYYHKSVIVTAIKKLCLQLKNNDNNFFSLYNNVGMS